SKYQFAGLETDMTADHHKVRKIVEGINPNDIMPRVKNAEEDYWVMKGALPPTSKHLVQDIDNSEVDLDRRMYKYHASRYFENMNKFAQTLSAIRGHKNIIYFSSGVAGSILYESPSPAFVDSSDDMECLQLRKDYEKLSDILGSSDSSFFVIDTGEYGRVLPQIKYIRGAQSLEHLGKETGGAYFDDLKNYRKIMDIIQNIMNSYYVLGYYIDEARDGKYHEITVKVNKEGLNVSAPKGYFDPKRSS
ncbi:MAG: hypothetical protein ABFD80_10450, partial [Acidobacteriota bacterium]